MISVAISEVIVETPAISSFKLEPVEGIGLPDFSAGAHIDVHIDDTLVRQYSLCNAISDGSHYRIAVLKDPNSRGGSVKLHEQFKAGNVIQISAPRNCFELDNACENVKFFAGGIGITPIMSMAYELAALSKNFELHYFAHSEKDAAFHRELANSPFAEKVHFHFGLDSVSRTEVAEQLLKHPTPGEHLYTCGPVGFMDFIFDRALANDWPQSALHKEVFAAEPQAGADDDQPFELVLARSNVSITVSPDQTALEALEEADIDVESSCEMGICGACMVKVIDGKPEHRDQYQTDAEKAANSSFIPCCSRALSESLIIDL